MSFQADAPITFGTDGWRAVIGRDFTYDSLFKVALAAGRVWSQSNPGASIVVGYDTRFQAGAFARIAAEALASCGLHVRLSDAYVPTPGLCYSVAQDEQAVGGVQLTASHNPAEYLGFKVRMADGGASPVEFTQTIEAQLAQLTDAEIEAARAFDERLIETCDIVGPYLDALYDCVDTQLLEEYAQRQSGAVIVVDPLYGAGQSYLARALSNLGINVREIHNELNPSFGGLHPEPIPPWTNTARAVTLANKASAAFITDGDADRIGALDEAGNFVSPHKIIALVAQHLVQDRDMRGRIVKTLSTSTTIDRLGRLLGCEVTTTPIGFKWIYAEMLKGDVLIGGEESGGIGLPVHVRERDGLLMALLLTEMMAQRNQTLKELVENLEASVGTMYYRRVDLRLTPEQKDAFVAAQDTLRPASVAGFEVRDIIAIDGIKMLFDDDQWLLLRPSGTEPLVRVYAETTTPEILEALLEAGQNLVTGGGE